MLEEEEDLVAVEEVTVLLRQCKKTKKNSIDITDTFRRRRAFRERNIII